MCGGIQLILWTRRECNHHAEFLKYVQFQHQHHPRLRLRQNILFHLLFIMHAVQKIGLQHLDMQKAVSVSEHLQVFSQLKALWESSMFMILQRWKVLCLPLRLNHFMKIALFRLNPE